MMGHSLVFLSLQSLILVGAFLAWPAMIKKIATTRKFESINPVEIQKMIRQTIQLRWRYGAWILMVWVFLKLFNQLNF